MIPFACRRVESEVSCGKSFAAMPMLRSRRKIRVEYWEPKSRIIISVSLLDECGIEGIFLQCFNFLCGKNLLVQEEVKFFPEIGAVHFRSVGVNRQQDTRVKKRAVNFPHFFYVRHDFAIQV